MKITAVDIRCVRTWIVIVLPAKQLYRMGAVITFKPLRKVNLINVPIVDLAFYFLYRLKVIILVHIAADLRKINILDISRDRFLHRDIFGFC